MNVVSFTEKGSRRAKGLGRNTGIVLDILSFLVVKILEILAQILYIYIMLSVVNI